ncbi:MAG: hypothetical protein NUK65_12440 [Firmicutes bacterium]|nr:hypothetical protein [Bacillota bacterium]
MKKAYFKRRVTKMFPNNVELLPQEASTRSTFIGQLVMTKGFIEKFSPNESHIAIEALVKIGQRVASEEGADYFQTGLAHKIGGEESIKFWCIDDGDYVTFLLPEEY